MKIGILQTGHAADAVRDALGDFDTLFAQLLGGHGFEFVAFDVVNGVMPEAITDADGWLITGSKHGAYEDHDFIPPLEQFIRDIYADGRPLVGVCFGHQIIAQAMGGKVEKFDAGWSVGRTEYSYDGEKVALNAWHQDQVVTRPEMAQTIASSDFCENAALVYGDKIWTIQPHPEFGNDVVDIMIDTRGKGVVPDPLLKDARVKNANPVDNAKIAQDMAAFFKREARHG